MPTYILYGTSNCHLCEAAIAIVQPILAVCTSGSLSIIDVANDESLFLCHGMHIPVLEHQATQRSLRWPFDSQSVLDFVNAHK